MKIAFVGDISLNGRYRDLHRDNIASIFSDVRLFLDEQKVDLLFANLESPLVGDGRENELKYPRLSTSEHALEALKGLVPTIVTLGNNHIYDCLDKGVEKTFAWLEQNHIHITGAYRRPEEANIPLRLRTEQGTISIFSYVAADTHPSLPPDASIILNDLQLQRIIEDIQKEKNSFIVVSLHWGIEFSHYPSPEQRSIARAIIDAGANVIVGHHSHTLQGSERWNDGIIFYNLGNFAFDDVLNSVPPVLWTKDQLHGGIGILEIQKGKKVNASLHVSVVENFNVQMEKSRNWDQKIEERSQPLSLDDCGYEKFWKRYQFIESVLKPPFRYFLGERKNFLRQLSRVRPQHIKKIGRYVSTFCHRTHTP